MNEDRKTITDFDEYIRQGEPEKREKAYIWQTAIGLQAVDGLTTSDYLNETAKRHIEGEIDIDEVRELIKTYYRSKSNREPDDDEKREADGVSANISKILSNRTLDFSTQGYIALHRRIFAGIFKHAGRVRDYNITKKEWVLENETVNYLNWEDLRRALDYDIEQERNFSYKGITADAMISHITRFVSGLWQIHAFGEGNTRTTAVFTIQYLRSIGFDITNDMFAKHSWYFRNALVRANYKNALKGIDYTPIYLERFFRNLLLGEKWDLRNRYLHINPTEEWKVQPNLADRTSAGQAQDKCAAIDDTLQDKLHTNNPNIEKLVRMLGEQQMSVKQIMEALGLKGRDNFLNLYLKPSISKGYVRLLYPDSPRHSRQKYLLTVKGLALYLEIIGKQ
ncbi:Fic family protein [uncultured Bacteroides sp.]|uniref:Fic family protein n=1 Tax=uncultured Bacteroides sp. TaxID=162156 RepID=UPI002635DFBA|nr:Fic family protein [uncultured Bacteroides sp.]